MSERKIMIYGSLVHDPEVSFEFFCEGESMTQQHMVDQTDVNRIVEDYTRTGVLPPSSRQGFYDDVTELNQPYDQLIERSRSIQAALASGVADSPPAAAEAPPAAPEVSSGDAGGEPAA